MVKMERRRYLVQAAGFSVSMVPRLWVCGSVRKCYNVTSPKQVTEESINAVRATAGAAIYGLVANGWTADIVLARPQSLASPIRSRAIRKRPKKLLHQWVFTRLRCIACYAHSRVPAFLLSKQTAALSTLGCPRCSAATFRTRCEVWCAPLLHLPR
jgi:hypothetical protein